MGAPSCSAPHSPREHPWLVRSPWAPGPHLVLDRSQKQTFSWRGDGKSSIFPGQRRSSHQPRAAGD